MKRITLISLILGTVLAVAPAAQAIVWSDGGDSSAKSSPTVTSGMSQAEYRAAMLRGEALNQKYGASTGLSQPEFRALKLRGEALNEQYGPGTTFRPDILGGDGGVSTATPIATGGDSFAWGTVGIGAATLAGVMLLALASVAVTRRRHVPSF